MKDDDKNSRYLDPDFNPMIPGDGDAKPLGPGEDKVEQGNRYLDPQHNPMIPIERDDKPLWTADEVSRMIERAFPGVNEIVLGPHKGVRMADGSVRLNDAPLAEAPDDVLDELCSALALCKK